MLDRQEAARNAQSFELPMRGEAPPKEHLFYDSYGPSTDVTMAPSLMQRSKTVGYEDCRRTALNTRAREGFRYWWLERPKPTNCESPSEQMMIVQKVAGLTKKRREPVEGPGNGSIT